MKNLLSRRSSSWFKRLAWTLIIFAALAAPPPAEAQAPVAIGTGSYAVGSTDTVIGTFKQNFFGNATIFTIGVYYTKGASEDSLSKPIVYHALSEAALAAGKGVQVSTDATLRYGHTAASEYKQETITLSGGIGYIQVKWDPIGTATDTFNVAPLIFIKPR